MHPAIFTLSLLAFNCAIKTAQGLIYRLVVQ